MVANIYGGNENLSFSIDNICDFLVYRYPMNHLFELKTIETPSIPLEKVFGKYDKAMQNVRCTDCWHLQRCARMVYGTEIERKKGNES